MSHTRLLKGLKVRRHKNVRGVLAVMAMLAYVLAPSSPAMASHGDDPTNVGRSETDGSVADQFDPNSKSVLTGADSNYFFDNGTHNVTWLNTGPNANPEVLPDSVGGLAATVGTTLTVTPSTAGTYYFYCTLHAGTGDIQTAIDDGDFDTGDPGKMVGRLIVAADSTAPVWGATPAAAASPISASQIDLSWSTATDDSGSVQYQIYEAAGTAQPPKPAAPVATVSGTSSSRTGLTAGVHYWYWITAVDGTGNPATPDLQADAATSSVAASWTASGVVRFAVDPTLAIQVSPSVLDVGTLNPAAAGTGTAIVTIQSNDSWSLSLKSIGRNAIDEALGDDANFTDGSGNTIPVGRATWDAGSGAAALTDVDQVMVTGQPATASAALNVVYVVQPLFTDPAGTDYQTTVLYTVTQP